MFRKPFLIFVLIVSVANSIFAQDNTSSIYLWVRGDLYRVDPTALTTEPITDSGTVSSPALSPTGTRIAYKEAAQVGLEALDRVEAEGEIAEIDLPANIAVFDASTGNTVTIAAQPEDASLLVEGVPDKAIVRSAPAWSPDGTRIAWTEFDFGTDVSRLMIYDLTSGTTSALIPEIFASITQGRSPEVRWGNHIFIINLSADEAGDQTYLIVSETGVIESTPRIAPVPDDYVLDFFPVEGESQTYVGLFYASGRWTILDGRTGVGVPFPDVPHLVNLQNPETSLHPRFDITPDMGMFWELLDTTMAFTGSPSRVTLSPDGQAAAFIGYPTFNGAAIWSADNITEIPNTGDSENEFEVGAILWGATVWQITLP